jgi:hypothetical protein
MPEQEEIRWCKIRGVGRVPEDPQTIFSTEILTFVRGVNSRIVRMKTKFSRCPCWPQLDELCEDIVTVVSSCKTASFWKRVEQVKSEWIPYNCHHHFRILNRVPRSLRGRFFRPKPYLLVIRTQVEPELVEGHNELPSLMFNLTEVLEQLICQNDTVGFLSGCEAVRNPSKMLHNKFKSLCQVSMNRALWNASELRSLPD